MRCSRVPLFTLLSLSYALSALPAQVGGPWYQGSKFYVDRVHGNDFATTTGTFQDPWQSISYGVIRITPTLNQGIPVTLTVMSGAYSFEAFPIRVPARGLALESYDENSVIIDGNDVAANCIEVNRPGAATGPNGVVPYSVFQGLTIQNFTGNGKGKGILINPALLGGGGPNSFEPYRVQVRNCHFTELITCIDIVTPLNWRSQHVVEENTFFGSTSGDTAISITGSGLAAELIRGNSIREFGDGILVSPSAANSQSFRPRIMSNMLLGSRNQINLSNCSPYIANNSLAYLTNTNPGFQVTYSAQPDSIFTLVNNILWDPMHSSNDLFIGGTPQVQAICRNDFSMSMTFPGCTNYSVDPLFVSTGDLHLQNGSPMIGAGDNAFIAPSPKNIQAGSMTARVDLGSDFDVDARILDFNRSGTATVDVGADEVPAGPDVTTYGLDITNGADSRGNILGGLSSVMIQFNIRGNTNDTALLYVWGAVGSGGIYQNSFTNPYGNLLIDPTQNAILINVGQIGTGGSISSSVVVNSAGLEFEFYMQAASISPSGSTGSMTNRRRFEFKP